MEIFVIKYLDCSKKKNRVLLVKEIMRILKCTEKPSMQKLEKVVSSVEKKYNFPIHKVVQKDNRIVVSVEVSSGSYSTFIVHSQYEFMCKYILFVKEYRKVRR